MKKILLLGSSGFIGSALLQELGRREDFSIIGTYLRHHPTLSSKDKADLREIDATKRSELLPLLQETSPQAIINTVAISTIDACEKSKERCDFINIEPTKICLEYCQDKPAVKYIFFSTDHVFDGKKEQEYVEGDSTGPLNHYGKTKLRCEQLIRSALHNYAILRPCLVFGVPQPHQHHNLFSTIHATLKQQKEFKAYTDKIRSPCYIGDLPLVVEQIIRKDKKGILLIGGETMTLYEFAKKIAEYFGLDQNLIRGVQSSGQEEAPRPQNCALDHSSTEKNLEMRFRSLTGAFQEIREVLP